MKRWFPWMTGLMAVAGLIWAFLYLKELHPLGALGAKLGRDHLEDISIRFKDARLVGWSEGKRIWTFKAGTVDVSKDRRLATFQGVTQGHLMRDDKKLASLSADKVVYNTITRNVAAPKGVEIRLEGGPSFKVRDVVWDSQQSELHCKGGVDAVLDGSILHGERMTANLKKKELVINKVKGSIRIQE